MGDRCIVKPKGKDVGVYLHWEGGYDSVNAFLKYCEFKGFRDFGDSYGIARFCQVVGNFIGGGLSLGVVYPVDETKESAIGLDNGIYVVDGWEIVNVIEPNLFYTEELDLMDRLRNIDITQPEEERLGDFLYATKTKREDIKQNDIVFIDLYDCTRIKTTVIGFGKDEVVNGTNVLGYPFVDYYSNGSKNINNYIRKDYVMVWKNE